MMAPVSKPPARPRRSASLLLCVTAAVLAHLALLRALPGLHRSLPTRPPAPVVVMLVMPPPAPVPLPGSEPALSSERPRSQESPQPANPKPVKPHRAEPTPLPPRPSEARAAQSRPHAVEPAPPQPRPGMRSPQTEPAPGAAAAGPLAESRQRADGTPGESVSPPAPRLAPAPDFTPKSERAAAAPGAAAQASGSAAQAEAERIEPAQFDVAYLNNPKPEYPRMARRLGEEGTVLLNVFVTSMGEPQKIELHRSSGSPRLDRAARETVRGWKFVPARKGNSPVAAWVIVPIRFVLEG